MRQKRRRNKRKSKKRKENKRRRKNRKNRKKLKIRIEKRMTARIVLKDSNLLRIKRVK